MIEDDLKILRIKEIIHLNNVKTIFSVASVKKILPVGCEEDIPHHFGAVHTSGIGIVKTHIKGDTFGEEPEGFGADSLALFVGAFEPDDSERAPLTLGDIIGERFGEYPIGAVVGDGMQDVRRGIALPEQEGTVRNREVLIEISSDEVADGAVAFAQDDVAVAEQGNFGRREMVRRGSIGGMQEHTDGVGGVGMGARGRGGAGGA